MMIRKLSVFASLMAAMALFTACGGDGDDDGGGGGNDGVNINKNTVTDEPAVARPEFPHLKGGSSIVIVHRTTGDTEYAQDGVNYSIEWDCDKKSSRWTCYVLTNTNKKQNVSRYYGQSGSGKPISQYTGNETYPKDPQLNDNYYWDRDYIYRSGFDHGHICPSNDRLYSYTANKQTFYLTNMQPQYSVFNGSDPDHKYKGLWINMESFVHDYKLNLTDTLYVCKGGTIDNESQILSRISGKVIVPKYFFAAILLKRSSTYQRAIGFWFEHTNVYHGDDDLKQYAVSIDELEEKTGIDFFCNLPDNIENNIESKLSTLQWGL